MYGICVMSFIYAIHLMCWNYLIDLITKNRNNRNNGLSATVQGCIVRSVKRSLLLSTSIVRDCLSCVQQQQGLGPHKGRAPRAPPSVVSVDVVVSVVSVLCDQVNQVVPAHQVDALDEAFQVDPVHHVDHRYEHTDRFRRP